METDRIGQVLGMWRLDKPIGRGGMGDVYLAHRIDGVVEQQAAVKVLHSTTSVGLPDEAATLRSIGHPNIVRYLDSALTADGHRYLVMEYIEGKSITEHADQKGLSILDRLRLFLQACDAVASAHQYLILHLDLKPTNVLVGRDNAVKVVDFGIARRLDGGDETEALDAWSGPYASPEQILPSSRLGFATDIYGLGATLYELLCGHEPFNPFLVTSELERQIAEEMPRPPSDAINQSRLHVIEPDKYVRVEPEGLARMRGGCGLPEVRTLLAGNLDRICLFALRKEPARRYKSVDQFRSDIASVLKRLPPEFAHSSGPGYLAWRTAQRKPLAVAAVVFSIAASYSGHLVYESQSASRHASLETKLRVDRVTESTLKELTDDLRPKLALDPRLRGSLEVLDAQCKAAALKPERSAAEEVRRKGDSIMHRLRRIIPGDALSHVQ
jgi:serine/threonine-protein kinase